MWDILIGKKLIQVIQRSRRETINLLGMANVMWRFFVVQEGDDQMPGWLPNFMKRLQCYLVYSGARSWVKKIS